MNRQRVVFLELLCVALLFHSGWLPAFSETTNSFFQFVQEQSERRYTKVPHEVLAFYYDGTASRDEAGGTIRTPTHTKSATPPVTQQKDLTVRMTRR
jgi:hypothetical protein